MSKPDDSALFSEEEQRGILSILGVKESIRKGMEIPPSETDEHIEW